MRQGLASGSASRRSKRVGGAIKAMEAALQHAQPGELLLIQADAIDSTVDFLRRYLESPETTVAKPRRPSPCNRRRAQGCWRDPTRLDQRGVVVGRRLSWRASNR